MPCCTDRLSLMAGTYGNVDLSSVPLEQLRLACMVREVRSLKGGKDRPSSASERPPRIMNFSH